jgi:L-ornithine N5-monooxygenase
MSLVMSEGTLPPGIAGPEGEGDEPLDVVGVGFGPSNLGLAIAIEEHNAASPRPVRAEDAEVREAVAGADADAMVVPNWRT